MEIERNVLYIDYAYPKTPNQISGTLTISEFDLADKPKSSFRFFEICSLSENFGCIIVNDKGYVPYYESAEDHYKCLNPTSFGGNERSFNAALIKLINNLSNIVLVGNFYKTIKISANVPVESP